MIREDIKPILHKDGGDIDIIDVTEKEDAVYVYIKYLGGCATCAAAGTGTLNMIESMLKEKMKYEIKVIMV